MDITEATIAELQARIDQLEAERKREENPPTYYFGVWHTEKHGHHVRERSGTMVPPKCERQIQLAVKSRPNGTFLYPWRGYHDRALGPEIEGELWHWKGDGLTLLLSWDRSADTRGNCCSTWIVMADVSPSRALELARSNYPKIFNRIESHIGKSVTLAGACPFT